MSGDGAPERLRFVSDVLGLIGDGPLRVVVVGYSQHDSMRRAGDAQPPVRAFGFASPDAAAAELAGWEPNCDDFAPPSRTRWRP